MEENTVQYGVKRIGIVGAGKMAMHHIKAIGLLKGARVVAVADPVADRNKMKEVLSDDIRIYSTLQDLLETEKPDIVHICTPPVTHVDLAKIALNHKAHVYLEKPFALHSKEANEVISLAKDRGLKVCAGHQLLYEPHMVTVIEQLEKIGNIVHVESYFSFRPVRRSMDGKTSMPPIEQLIDILPHPVYLLQFFMRRDDHRELPLEIGGMHVRTDGNVHGILSCGNTTGVLVVTLTGRPIESYIKIIGTNGSLCAEFVRGTFVTNPGPGISGISKVIFPYSQAWQNVKRTTQALYRRFRKKQKSYPGLLELIDAFYESLDPGKKDALSESGILETVAICEEVAEKLRSMEEQENRAAERKYLQLESEMPPAEPGLGKVLVTGGTGLLGRAVVKELRRNRFEVRTISRKNQPYSERVPGVEYLTGNLANQFPREFLQGVSAVVHCAAETAGGKEAHEANSIGATKNILEAMARSDARKLIHISSIGILESSREYGRAIDESTPIAGDPESRGPYVWGKAESERLVSDLGKSLGVDVRIIRPGPLVDYDAFSAPGRLGREAGPFFVLVGKREDRLSLCDVQTVAEVIRYYLGDFRSAPSILNLIEPGAPTRGELVSTLTRHRPDLSIVRIPFGVFRCLSVFAKLLQRILRPGKKPIDIYAAFASEKYDSTLAGNIISRAKATIQSD